MSKRTTRVQLELPEASFKRLKRLRDDAEAASYSEVIKAALRLYEGLLADTRDGSELILRRPNGETISLRIVT